jgi:hypothetical protein
MHISRARRIVADEVDLAVMLTWKHGVSVIILFERQNRNEERS